MFRPFDARLLPAVLSTGLLLLGGCGGGDGSASQAAKPAGTRDRAAEGPASSEPLGMAGGAIDDGRELPELEKESYDLEIPDVTYTWDPQAGDPSVSAQDGGPGFTGEGWESNFTFPALGSAKAKKGGRITMYEPSWPATLRLSGKDYNTSFNYRAVDLCTEGLLSIHPNTLEFIPMLATHWKISEDKMTFSFRINPEARWSDGKEVTSADVLATYKLRMDERTLFPSDQITFGKLNPPRALSKYIVEVTAKDLNWRNFMYFGSSMPIFPAHEISIPGDEYLKKYQNKYTALTGPYWLDDSGIEMNKSLTLKRRDDWWARDNPAFTGLYNFDEYHFIIVQDQNLAFEKAKKGEFDYFWVNKSQWWVEELVPSKVDAIQRGLIQKHKFFNDAPIGTAGMAINMTRPPLDDVRMRRALSHLRNRPLLIDELFFNEYGALSSYYQGGTYQNPNNKELVYDPLTAVDLLEEMGWTKFDSEGYRTKDGRRLRFEVSYRDKLFERNLTIYQEDCKRAGIELELKLLDQTTHWKNVRQRQYDLSSMAWGALVFPNPETSFSGELAKLVDNNNITGFSNARVDELLEEYDVEYDVNRRIEIIREIDGIIYEATPYVLDWYSPCERVMYWNRFSQPDWGIWRTNDKDNMMYCWWVDPEKEKKLEAAKKDPKLILETQPILNRFWQHWHAAQAQ
jgi:microcin C transport system substrate-binding protein